MLTNTSHKSANVGRNSQRFDQVWPNSAKLWPESANFGQIWARSRLPEHLFDNVGARRVLCRCFMAMGRASEGSPPHDRRLRHGSSASAPSAPLPPRLAAQGPQPPPSAKAQKTKRLDARVSCQVRRCCPPGDCARPRPRLSARAYGRWQLLLRVRPQHQGADSAWRCLDPARVRARLFGNVGGSDMGAYVGSVGEVEDGRKSSVPPTMCRRVARHAPRKVTPSFSGELPKLSNSCPALLLKSSRRVAPVAELRSDAAPSAREFWPS